jgi:L-fuconolactonase
VCGLNQEDIVTDLRRRALLKTGSCFALLHGARQFGSAYTSDLPGPARPIIDAHIHLFDPTRSGGVPWPDQTDTVLYRPALPPRYKSLAMPLGVVGAIAVECSPWVEDNDWLLRVAATDTIIVGVIGNLDPATPGFSQQLERFGAKSLFRGIRYGNLWERSLGAQLNNPDFMANLKRLSSSGLLLESANPNPVLIGEILKLTDRIPDLSIVIDHLPQALPPTEPAARKAYEQDLQSLSQRSHVFVKGSEVLRRVDGKVPTDLNTYKPWLDEIWETFGEDRLLYGSDWPNSDHLSTYEGTYDIIKQYVTAKGPRASEKFFWKNSTVVYRWRPRSATQPRLDV